MSHAGVDRLEVIGLVSVRWQLAVRFGAARSPSKGSGESILGVGCIRSGIGSQRKGAGQCV